MRLMSRRYVGGGETRTFSVSDFDPRVQNSLKLHVGIIYTLALHYVRFRTGRYSVPCPIIYPSERDEYLIAYASNCRRRSSSQKTARDKTKKFQQHPPRLLARPILKTSPHSPTPARRLRLLVDPYASAVSPDLILEPSSYR